MIPLKIIYKDQVYTDKIDITPEEIYQRLPEEIPVHLCLMVSRSQKSLSKSKRWL